MGVPQISHTGLSTEIGGLMLLKWHSRHGGILDSWWLWRYGYMTENRCLIFWRLCGMVIVTGNRYLIWLEAKSK